jgi:hypothetical protein
MATYLPARDEDLRSWGENFVARLAADPGRYGVYENQITTVRDALEGFSDALTAATAPGTRTQVTVTRKDGERAAFVAAARTLAMLIKGHGGVSGPDKTALGLRPPGTPLTKVLRPSSAPVLRVIGATPGEHTVRYADASTSGTRAKPAGVLQLILFAAVEDGPVTDFRRARFVGAYTRQPFAVAYEATEAGQTATYWGRWNTRTALLGPLSAPVSFTIAF